MVLKAVGETSVEGLAFDAVLDLLRLAKRPLELSFLIPASQVDAGQQGSVDAGPIVKEGELLKLEVRGHARNNM